ncbi:MAG: hypothetical protein JSW61_14700 [Candidatus Thorarchaeota archaeon]|nr:MAG: hypothetical protein JSW61_14700 [Candidatus Thorarchaeota archaeon]
MGNIIGAKPAKEIDMTGVTVYTSKLFELNVLAQEAVRDFSLHDIDDKAGLEKKRIQMHDVFSSLYEELANFNEETMIEDFHLAYLRERISQIEGEQQQQLQEVFDTLTTQAQNTQADVWLSKVLSWLHQAAAASGPFVEEEHEEKIKSASKALSAVYTMLERPFSAIPAKVDGTQKLRRVALGHKAYSLVSEKKYAEETELAEILGKNKLAEAEFYDEFLNELIGVESTFRQAFNPFDELVWRDMLASFIFEQATDLYNEAIPHLKKSKEFDKAKMSLIDSWKKNTAGLSEVYLAMTYNDIADAQMRSGNLEDASQLYTTSSDAFGRAEKLFRKVPTLVSNADQSKIDKEHKKAQAFYCRAEAAVLELTRLLMVDNREESLSTLQSIFKDLNKAEKLSKTRELSNAIKENLRTFSFVEELLKKKDRELSGILEQIEFAKDLRKTGLISDVGKALDEATSQLTQNPSDALEAIREGLISLGILLSLESEDEEVGGLRNKTLALLNNVKYVIQFQLSGQLEQGVKFIQSRILENLHAAEAASYYKVVDDLEPADELTDLGRLALATAYASEAQIFSRLSEQWAFRAQLERANTFRILAQHPDDFDQESIEGVLRSHDKTILKLKQAVASYQAAAGELGSVRGEEIKKNNNVEAQVTQLRGVVMKFRGDLSRMEGAKSDFLAEFRSRKGDMPGAQKYYTDASDALREAVGNYTVAVQVFQQVGDSQAAQRVDGNAKVADLLARGVWDNRQRIERDQEPSYLEDAQLTALYQGGAQ